MLLVLAGLSAGLTVRRAADGSVPHDHPLHGRRARLHVAFTIFSGLAPLLATTLIQRTGAVTSPAYLMMTCAVLALGGSLWVERYGGNMLSQARRRQADVCEVTPTSEVGVRRRVRVLTRRLDPVCAGRD
jgi:MFS transporter, MHS family, proline/betaine transporter